MALLCWQVLFKSVGSGKGCLRERLRFGEIGAKKNTNKIRQLSGTYISETTGAISFKFGM